MKGKYWIQFTTWLCPVCGKEETYQVRIYDRPKPKDYHRRHIIHEVYDYCNSL